MYNNSTGKVKDFLGKTGPTGYIAGLGRGASGFMTRPDIGPARENVVIEEPEEEQFDENEAGLLSRGKGAGRAYSGFNDPEDDEADRIYAEIDDKMGERRRSRREKMEQADEERQEASLPKTKLLFADLKRDLSRVSEAEWAALPEVGDFRIKRLKRSGAIENAKERFLPVPDSVHSGHINRTSGLVQEAELEEEEQEADFAKIGEARGKLLGMHLDQASKTISIDNRNTHTLDTVALPDTGIAVASDEKLADIGDLKRARQLFASIIKSNRKNPSGWISAARLEVQAGNQKQARALIMKGCEECPKSEEVWKEAIKLHEDSLAREILARALRNLPESISLWLYAAEKETDLSTRRKIVRSALERNPSNPKLWMTLVELEDSEGDARLLLTRAVECASNSTELWLALARLQEDTDSARQVLNRARLACPKSFSIWINAARLEEANDSTSKEIHAILTRGAAELSAQGVDLSFEDWRKEAEDCELGGDFVCATELIKIGVDLALSTDSEGAKTKIIEYSKAPGNTPKCSRNALTALLHREKDCKEAFLVLLDLLEQKDDDDDDDDEDNADYLKELFEMTLETLGSCSPDLWIRYARHFREESRLILEKAAAVLSQESDRIFVLKESIALEMRNFRKFPDSAQKFFEALPCHQCELMVEMMKAYLALGMRVQALELAKQGSEQFPKEAEFWLLLARHAERDDDGQSAISILNRGLQECATSVKLVLRIAELERDANSLLLLLERTRVSLQKSKAARLDQIEGLDQLLATFCLLHCPESVPITVFPSEFTPYKVVPSVRIPSSSLQAAKLFLNQFIKDLPKSAILWHLAVALEPRHLRRSKVTEALRRFENTIGYEEQEALLRWTLAMLLEDNSTPRTNELNAAQGLDPNNLDLKAFLRCPPPEHLVKTTGTNWKRFIDENNLHFEPVEGVFNLFISKMA